MRIKEEVIKLRSIDIYSFMLFALYKIKDVPEYSGISELSYVLDKDNLLKLCEYFGGTTIKIPTVEELESLVYALVLYQYVDVEHMTYDSAIKIIGHSSEELRAVKSNYIKIKDILDSYEFAKREGVCK